MKKNSFFILILLLTHIFYNNAALIDNRFLPLFRPMFKRSCQRRSAGGSNVFFLIANQSLGNDGKEIGLPEVNGKYDLLKVAKSLEIIGKPNPLSTQFRIASKLELDLEGKLEGQGAWLGYECNFFNNFALGFSFYVMHLSTRENFVIPDSLRQDLKLNRGSEIILEKELRETNNLLGLNTFQFNKTGVSDLDLYLRFGVVRDYFYKFRKIDFGIDIGCLFPSGMATDINNPISIPFGGDGHFGFYGLMDLTLELKEDLSVGFWFEILQRLKKTQIKRMPVNNEPLQFGPIIGPACVNPGVTIGFSPFVSLDDIRDGFGFKVKYSLIFHGEDDWTDKRKDRTIATDLGSIVELSEWSSEYFTFTLLYDFAKGATKPRKFAPIVYLEWDRPSSIFKGEQFAKTNRVSFGFEFSF